MNEWPHLLADLRAKRDALSAAIETLETHFTIPNGDAAPGNGHAAANVRGSASEPKPQRAAKQTNERTNERARTAPSRSAEPP